MLEENKNLKSQIKDTSSTSNIKNAEMSVSYGTEIFRLGSYNKTNKLISALYMVTDIMDKEEPLRGKLRNSGTNIISDMHSSFNKGQSFYNQINNRISEILSFIEIGSSVGIISEMNSNILIKEFIELRKSITEIVPKKEENWLQEFMKEDKNLESKVLERNVFSIGQNNLPTQVGTRIGVQKGSTLMKALSDKVSSMSNKNSLINNNHITGNTGDNFDKLKRQRREEIIQIIKIKKEATISDIKNSAKGVLISCGEKTLQRELVSMVVDGVLKRSGEKRWSKYFL